MSNRVYFTKSLAIRDSYGVAQVRNIIQQNTAVELIEWDSLNKKYSHDTMLTCNHLLVMCSNSIDVKDMFGRFGHVLIGKGLYDQIATFAKEKTAANIYVVVESTSDKLTVAPLILKNGKPLCVIEDSTDFTKYGIITVNTQSVTDYLKVFPPKKTEMKTTSGNNILSTPSPWYSNQLDDLLDDKNPCEEVVLHPKVSSASVLAMPIEKKRFLLIG